MKRLAATVLRTLSLRSINQNETPAPARLSSHFQSGNLANARLCISNQPRFNAIKRLLRNNPAESSDTNTPTGKISEKVIGTRYSGFL